jgi:crotonobetainyl-CoA:carnitine CoA-transferase CaiB-like acyl-CoA transferase
MAASAQTTQTVLDGIRVLDFSRVLAGPYCTATLGDLGADVIKIESPDGGDPSRGFGPPEIAGESTYFLQLNRNKRSVVLDLATDAGKAAARRLALKCDVIVENFRPGVMTRLGLDYANIALENPQVVYCSISGYGSDGPLAQRAGLDPVIQAESGLMAMTGETHGEPMRIGISLVDATSGMFASQAILAALLHRQNSGVGQRVDVALFDTGVNMLVNFAANFLMAGATPSRPGNGNLVAQPSGVYQTADGSLVLTCVGDATFKRMCVEGLGEPELAANPRFIDNSARIANVQALSAELNRILASAPRKVWIERLRSAGIPAGEIRSVEQALTSEEFELSNLVDKVEHPSAGPLNVLRSPMRLSQTPIRTPRPAPLLGEHTQAVLSAAGFDGAELQALLTAANGARTSA